MCHGCVTPFVLLFRSESYTPVCFVQARHGSFCFPPPFITAPPTNVLRSSAPINTISFSLDVSVGSVLFSASLVSCLATHRGGTHRDTKHRDTKHNTTKWRGGTHTPSTHTPGPAPHGPAPTSPAHLPSRPRPSGADWLFRTEQPARGGAGQGCGARCCGGCRRVPVSPGGSRGGGRRRGAAATRGQALPGVGGSCGPGCPGLRCCACGKRTLGVFQGCCVSPLAWCHGKARGKRTEVFRSHKARLGHFSHVSFVAINARVGLWSDAGFPAEVPGFPS